MPTCGIQIKFFHRLVYWYQNDIPDNPGGGTVRWTNRWGGYRYISDIEVKEDGGTPGFLHW